MSENDELENNFKRQQEKPAQPNIAASPAPKKKKSGLLIVAIVVVTAALAGLGTILVYLAINGAL